MKEKIREMKREDIPNIMKMEKELFAASWEEEMFIEEIEKQYAYVLEIKNKIIGYICGWKLLDEFNITNIAVAPDFQRKGFGKVLVKFLMSKLLDEKCFKFFLEVRESNQAAKKLYDKLGFVVIGLRKNYYHSPEEDAMVLGTNLIKIIKKRAT
ncbi:MAG: ribosomal-protein-alanine N-acetyltransferase [Candidatus Cloacimonadota bacterium]|nr:MAG: ribosomal-protein-alanine N-acetyltransferase [Candidatus Cloacimonadota bacterium]